MASAVDVAAHDGPSDGVVVNVDRWDGAIFEETDNDQRESLDCTGRREGRGGGGGGDLRGRGTREHENNWGECLAQSLRRSHHSQYFCDFALSGRLALAKYGCIN